MGGREKVLKAPPSPLLKFKFKSGGDQTLDASPGGEAEKAKAWIWVFTKIRIYEYLLKEP